MFKVEMHKELAQITSYQDTTLGIVRWGRDNSFPQTLRNLIEQSSSAKAAVKRAKKFLAGMGFVGDKTIVSPYGLTLKRVVGILADDYATYEAFAIQCNYNMNGQVVDINPMRIAELRFNEFDELNFASKIGYHANFGRNSEVRKTVVDMVTRDKIRWIDRFNPETVMAQIAATEGGIGNYNGQILYYSEAGHSSYPIPPLQAPINFVLSDVENSILVRKETSTGFISSYILKTTMDSEDPTLIALENALEQAQGARGLGKIVTMAGLSPEDLQATVLEEIGSGASGASSIIESATKSYRLSREVILGSYLIPPILAGDNSDMGFTEPDLRSAYFVYNSITQDGRDTIEYELNRILENSVFKVKEIKLNKLHLDSDADQGTATTDDTTTTKTV